MQKTCLKSCNHPYFKGQQTCLIMKNCNNINIYILCVLIKPISCLIFYQQSRLFFVEEAEARMEKQKSEDMESIQQQRPLSQFRWNWLWMGCASKVCERRCSKACNHPYFKGEHTFFIMNNCNNNYMYTLCTYKSYQLPNFVPTAQTFFSLFKKWKLEWKNERVRMWILLNSKDHLASWDEIDIY